MESEKTLLEIPKRIKQASNLVYLSLLIGLIKLFLIETITNIEIPSDPKIFIMVIIMILIIGFLGYMIRQGKNWIRITVLVLFTIGMINYPFLVFNEFKYSYILGTVSIVQMLIQLYVLIILFSGESKIWFKKQKEIKNTSKLQKQ